MTPKELRRPFVLANEFKEGDRPHTFQSAAGRRDDGRRAAAPRVAHPTQHVGDDGEEILCSDPRGKPADAAAHEIARTVGRILEQRVLGVTLRESSRADVNRSCIEA